MWKYNIDRPCLLFKVGDTVTNIYHRNDHEVRKISKIVTEPNDGSNTICDYPVYTFFRLRGLRGNYSPGFIKECPCSTCKYRRFQKGK